MFDDFKKMLAQRRLKDVTIRKCIKNSARHLKQGNSSDKELR